MKLQIPQNLSYTTTSKRNLGKKSIFIRLSTTNIDQQLPNSESRLIRTFPVENGRWDKTPLEKRMCPLCFSNDIGDERHYIFHCTNPKLVEVRKTLTPEIYETFSPCPDVNSINDILHIILRGSPSVNYNRTGKFLSFVLEKTQDLLMEVEKGEGSTSRN